MTLTHQLMDQATLDAAYNNSLGVAHSGAMMDAFTARSDILRAAHPTHLDLAYGPKTRQRLDYFPASQPGPLLVFIHGGYWQMRAKENFSFLAEAALQRGMHVAMIGYTLAPDISLSGIVDEVKSALHWIREHLGQYGANVDHMIVSGWSAGGHLTALCLDEPGVVAGVAISGIYDLTPIRHSYVNDKLQLTEAEVQACSPAFLPLSDRPLVLAYGLAELPGLIQQSESFAQQRQQAPGKCLALEGHNHFTIMEEMAQPDGRIAAEIFKLAGL
jgi:arylformamidase